MAFHIQPWGFTLVLGALTISGVSHVRPVTTSPPNSSEELSVTPFEQGESYSADVSRSTLYVAGCQQAARVFSSWLEKDRARRLSEVAFGSNWVVAAFSGATSSTGYGIEIRRAQRRGDAVELRVEVSEPPGGRAQSDVITYPYHIVLVPKDDAPPGSLWRMVHTDGQVLAETRALPCRDSMMGAPVENPY